MEIFDSTNRDVAMVSPYSAAEAPSSRHETEKRYRMINFDAKSIKPSSQHLSPPEH